MCSPYRNDFLGCIRMHDAEGHPHADRDLHGPRIELSRVQLEQGRLPGVFMIYRQHAIPEKHGAGIELLLNRCYPKPPRDVFERMRNLYKPGDPLYTLEHEGRTAGMVYCARHSKGGHLENLAVDPDYRGLGLAGRLVETLMRDNPEVITLTTRIPAYFERFGFKVLGPLTDGSIFMAATTSPHSATAMNTDPVPGNQQRC